MNINIEGTSDLWAATSYGLYEVIINNKKFKSKKFMNNPIDIDVKTTILVDINVIDVAVSNNL